MEDIDAYIPDQQFRRRDPRFSTRRRLKILKDPLFTKDDFIYGSSCYRFICPAGKILKYSDNQKLANTEGIRYISSRSNCNECLLRDKCVRSDTTRYRTLYVVEKYFNRNDSDEMRLKIDSVEAREIFSRRMKIVEPVFGNIRSCKNLNRFTLRTKEEGQFTVGSVYDCP